MEILQVVAQSFLSIAVLFFLARIEGKCSISQLTMFDYINSITIGSIAAELATNLEDWPKPLTAMLIYGLVTALIGWLRCKWLPLRRFVNGKPTILLENGLILKDNLLKVKLDINEFLTQCRVAGYFDLDQLKCVIMETNGLISFLPKAQQRPDTPKDLSLEPDEESLFVSLIFDGRLLRQNLENFGKNEQWLYEKLHAAGIGQISEVFLACCDESGNFRAYRIPKPGPEQKSVFE